MKLTTAAILLLTWTVAACAADKVTLKNGEVLTGAIVKKDGGKLTIRSESAGEVSVPWASVQTITSDETLTVTLPDGSKIAGKLTTTGDRISVAPATGTATETPLATVGDIRNPAEQRSFERLQHPGVFELWTGFFDAGLALARGNAHTETLSTAASATRVTRHDKVVLQFRQIYGTARVRIDDTTTTPPIHQEVAKTIANAIRGGWSYNRDIASRLFVSTLNDYEYDQFQNLDLRFAAGAGLGYNVVKNPTTTLGVLAGMNYLHESFSDNNKPRSAGEFNFGDDLLHKVSAATSITQSFRFFANLSDAGQYRVNFDLSAVTAIKKWLGWQVSASDRFLSNPIAGRQRNDLLLSTGLRVSFAR